MATVLVQGKQAHYREWGSGESTIVILHGWSADSSQYTEFAPLLGQAGYRVLVPDLPGFGGTPEPERAWSVGDYMRWVEDFVTALNVPTFFLFGHSFGGRVSIKYILQYPYRVRALMLCASAGIRPDPLTMKRRMMLVLAKIGNVLFRIPGIHWLAPLARRILYRLAGSNDYLRAQGTMKETMVRVVNEDLSPLLPEIKHPALIIWGSDDKATPLRDGQEMARHIPRAHMEVIEGAPHNLPKREPVKTAERVLAFLASDAARTITDT